MKRSCFSFLLFGQLLLPAAGQAQEEAHFAGIGLPFIQNFSPNDYGGAHAQNWAVLQDNRGVMYFGNSIGVLEFDGVSWRLISIPNAVVRSLAMDESGTVYVGGRGEFGYLAPDSIGALHYVSLVEKIPEAFRDFSTVWQIFANKSGIYAGTYEFLFRWQPQLTSPKAISDNAKPVIDGELRIWQPQTSISRLFVFGDTVFVQQPEIGLMHLVGDSLQIVPNGKQFSDIYIRIILALPGQNTTDKATFLLCTRESDFFLYDMQSIRPFHVDAAIRKYLNTYRLYHGAVLPDNSIALSSSGGGLAVMDTSGHLQKYINRKSGLRSESVYFVYSDRQGGMWLALNNGIARVEYPAPFSYFNEQSGLQGNIAFIQKHDGRLYTGSNTGIYMLSEPPTEENFPAFEQIQSTGGNTGSFLPDDETLLVSARDIYHIEKDKSVQAFNFETDATVMIPSRFRQDIAFVGLRPGLAVLKKAGKTWHIAGQVAGVKTDVRSIAEEAPSELWLGNMNAGFSQVRIPGIDALTAGNEQQEIPATVIDYGDSLGVPQGTGRVSRVADKVVFATNGGLRRFDAQRGIFLPDSIFGSRFADSTRMVSHIIEDTRGNVWVKSTKDNIRETAKGVRGKDGEYTWDITPFRRIADWGSVYDLYADPEESQVLWIGGPSGLIRYDESVPKNYRADFRCLLRKVIVNRDSTIFAGVATAADESLPPTLNYVDNNLRFQFAATSFEVPSANRYQFFLEGFDKRWSGWTDETQKDYTNIPEGSYAFRVRAKNIYDHLSSEDSYVFSVLPPWYRSWWAYVFYGLAFLGMLYSIRRYEMGRQQLKHNAKLREVEANKLQELDGLKSRFFANISHEFRTPLTLIMGQTESLLPDEDDAERKSKLQMSLRNAKQLLGLINQLLDLSKFEAGQATLKASQQNLVVLLQQMASSFESMAQQRRITLGFECDESEILLFFEQDKMEKIIQNLLSNALKFTPPGGKVLLKAEVEQSEQQSGSVEPAGEVKITVRDTGAGIPGDQLPHVFDRFYQVDSSQTREFEGTGIGLALTKDLVQLHGGGISVESSEGFGTTFVVRLPLGNAHLKPEQIVDAKAGGRRPEAGGSGQYSVTGDQLPVISDQSVEPSNQHPPSSVLPSPSSDDFILIVEDNADMRSYIRESLAQDFNILESPNGEDGFAKAQEIVPDLIITDAMMPKMDGYELTRKIRLEAATCHIPIIMLTARADEEDKFEGLETGVDAYLTKPFNKKELHIRVRKLIEMRKQLRQQAGPKAILTPSEIKASSMDQQFLQRIREIIDENLENEDFSVDDLALKAGVGIRQLQRKLRAFTDSSPQQCIRTMRLLRARQLLEQGAGTVSEICFQVGYGNVNAFARAFREEFGVPPSSVRKS